MKKLLIILMVLTILVTSCNKEEEKNNLIEYEKLDYDSVEDLLDLTFPIDENGRRSPNYSNICFAMYTVDEDGLEDEIYEIAFKSELGGISQGRWWIFYDIIKEKSYEMNDGKCTITGLKPEKVGNIYLSTTYDFFGRARVIGFSGLKMYETATTYEIVDAIRHFEVVSNGEGTEGFQESLDFLYAKAKENGDFNTSKESIVKVASVYNETLGNLATMSDQKMIEEIASNYDVYEDFLFDVEDEVRIIKKSKNKETTED